MSETLNDYIERAGLNPAIVRALGSVIYERRQQDNRWGEQNHDPEVWLAILTEEVGELAQAMLNDRFPGEDHGGGHRAVRMRAEAQQVAAVAVAFIEYLDRNRIGQCPSCSGTGLSRSGHHRACSACDGSGDR